MVYIDFVPSVAVLELTYRCNHACRFCSCPWFGGLMSPGRELDIAEWKRLVETYADLGVSQFSFTGGEALMKEGCLELLDFAAARCSVGLLSNGRLVTDEIIRFCGERNIRLSMSLPGLRAFPENTDSDTPVEKILSHFRYASEVGCATTVGIAVTKLNLPELYETISAATDFFTVGPNGRLRVCNHSPVELVRWDEWERLPECAEWMHYSRHDYLPDACSGCTVAARCLGGCREAARVFYGSPVAPDPVCTTVKPIKAG